MMNKRQIPLIFLVTFLALNLAIPMVSCESDGSVTVVVASDSPTTVVVNGQIVPHYTIIKKHYNPIRLKRQIRELAEALGEQEYALIVTMKALNTTMTALKKQMDDVKAQEGMIYEASLKIGDLEANFNGNGIELKNFEKYTDEQLSILFDGLEALRSEITMELSALTTRIEDVETTTTRLEERQNTLRAHVATRDTWYTLGILACFAILGGIFVGVWTSRK